MPNETQNILLIKGNKKTIEEFINKHVVNPEEDSSMLWWNFDETCKIIDIDNDDELMEKWGTCRNAIYTKLTDNSVLLETAWSPCNEWLKNIYLDYPNLSFLLYFYDEFSEEFYGHVLINYGNLVNTLIEKLDHNYDLDTYILNLKNQFNNF